MNEYSENPGMTRLRRQILAHHFARFAIGNKIALIGDPNIDWQLLSPADSISIDLYGHDSSLTGTERFDSIVALGLPKSAQGFPESIVAWMSGLQQGGRLLFEVISRDHIESLQRHDRKYTAAPGLAACSFDELFAFANTHHLRIVALIPYGAVLGGDWNGWLAGSWADGIYWRRLLSWCVKDERLFEWLVFLETRLVAQLPIICSARFIAVLENAPAQQENEIFRQRQEALSCLPLPIRPESLALLQPDIASILKAALDQPLSSAYCRLVFFCILSALDDLGLVGSLSDWRLDEPRYREVSQWLEAYRRDRLDYRFVTHWHRDTHIMVAGVPLAIGLEYELMRHLVQNCQ